MALVPDQKFSTFDNGGDLQVGDIIVGLRNGLNTRFNYTGQLPLGFIVPVSQGGTDANNVVDARTNLGLGTMATQNANNVNITGGVAALTSLTLATALAKSSGGTGVTSATTTPTANEFSAWDADSNLRANNFIEGFATTATAGGTTTLTVSSAGIQEFTGTLTQTVVMPVTTTLIAGHQFVIINNSSGNLTINSSGGNLILTMAANTTAFITCVVASGTGAASWNASYVFDQGAGVLSITGTPNQIAASSSTGNVTLSLPAALDFPGTFTVQNTVDIDEILDEDNMASDSATALATQQSIKAYADQVGGFRSVQIFTSNGTWTKPAGIRKILAIGVSGGGGGGYANTTAGNAMVGAGGAGGGYSQKLIDVTAIASIAVTIGAAGAGGVGATSTAATAGGTTSFGAHFSIPGGGAGGVSNNSSGNFHLSGGMPGSSPTGGDINRAGAPGQPSIRVDANNYTSGNGGASFFSGGGSGGGSATVANANGGTPDGYGGGGGGARATNGNIQNGGNGTAGIIVVYEYA